MSALTRYIGMSIQKDSNMEMIFSEKKPIRNHEEEK
jgi:hypothetical protein